MIRLLSFFHPIDGADAGFDPIDHTQVDSRLGTWDDVAALAARTDVMADVIVNHISSRSPQFEDYYERGDESPYAGMFLTYARVFANGAQESDLLALYRPRPGLPFTAHTTARGQQVLLWTTCDGSFAIPLHTSDTLVMTRCVGARSCRTFASPSNVMSVIPARHSFARFVPPSWFPSWETRDPAAPAYRSCASGIRRHRLFTARIASAGAARSRMLVTPAMTVASARPCRCGFSLKPPRCERRTRLSPSGRDRGHRRVLRQRPPCVSRRTMRQDATFRKMEVIGQAAKNLSEQTKSREPEIPWKQFAGMRDKVSYDYFGVNLEIVWGMVQKEPHKLRQAIAALSGEIVTVRTGFKPNAERGSRSGQPIDVGALMQRGQCP